MKFFCLNSQIWFSDSYRDELGQTRECETKISLKHAIEIRDGLDKAIRDARKEDAADLKHCNRCGTKFGGLSQ